jgi:hypothetical protein
MSQVEAGNVELGREAAEALDAILTLPWPIPLPFRYLMSRRTNRCPAARAASRHSAHARNADQVTDELQTYPQCAA